MSVTTGRCQLCGEFRSIQWVTVPASPGKSAQGKRACAECVAKLPKAEIRTEVKK